VNAHGPALPLVLQFNVVPSIVPSPEPDATTPAQVAVYTMVAVFAPVGVTENVTALQPATFGTPDGSALDVHVPANAASALDVPVDDGVVGLVVCEPPLHADTEAASVITPNLVSIRIGSNQV
jgi:hypothetical protein